MSKRSALLRLAAAYGRHQVRRRLPGRRAGADAESALLEMYRADGIVPLTPEERERLPELSGCIGCGLCALAAGRLGATRLPDLASAYLRPYPLLTDASGDVEGSEPDLSAASAACPAGVPLEGVAAMVRRLAGV